MRTPFMCAVWVAAEYLIPSSGWIAIVLVPGIIFGGLLDWAEATE